MTKICNKFTIIGFIHPDVEKSVVYKQGITLKTLQKTIEENVAKGCNLFSIRAFSDQDASSVTLEKVES